MLPRPNFTSADNANLIEVNVDMGFASPVKINYVLYSEPDFQDWTQTLFDHGIEQFKA